jgi:hypothetical protein
MTRDERLRALADLHKRWVADNLAAAAECFAPQGRKAGSDYNQHHVDLDAPVEAQDEFDRQALAIVRGQD